MRKRHSLDWLALRKGSCVIRGFQGRLLRHTAIIALATLLIFCLACYILALIIIVDNERQSYHARLQTVDRQVQARMQAREDFIGMTASQITTRENVEAFLRYPSAIRQHEALLSLQSLLTRWSYNQPQLTQLMLVTSGGVVTGRGVSSLAMDTPPGRLSDAQTVRLLSAALNAPPYAERNISTATLGEEALLVGIMDDAALFSMPRITQYLVFDSEGTLLFSQADDALVEKYQAQADPGKRFGAQGSPYQPVHYTNTESGLRYVHLLDLSVSLKAMLAPAGHVFAAGLGAAVLVMLLAVAVSQWVMRPLNMLTLYAQDSAKNPMAYQMLLSRLRTSRRMQLRVFALYCLALLPMLALLPLAVRHMEDAAMAQLQAVFVDATAQNADRIAEEIETLRQLGANLAYDDEIRTLADSGEPRADRDAALLRILYRSGALSKGFVSLSLYSPEGTLLAATSVAPEAALTPQLLSTFSRNYAFSRLLMDPRDTASLSLLMAIREVSMSAPGDLFAVQGILRVDMLNPIAQTLQQDDSGTWYLYDRDAWQLVATPYYAPYRPVVEGMAQGGLVDTAAQTAQRRMRLSDDNGDDLLLLSAAISDTPYTLLRVTTLGPLRALSQNLAVYMALAVSVLLLLMLLAAMLSSIRILRVMRQTERYFLSATMEDHTLPPALTHENEVSALAQAFDVALTRIEELSETVIEKERTEARLINRRRQAEVVALQSQMDSHLISNIFASMKILLRGKDLALLDRVIDATGTFLRSGLVHNEYDVPLVRELEHVQAYLAIQRIRFHDRLHVVLPAVPPELLACMVPKYLLQPLIENAILHGMRPQRTLRIEVTIHRKGDALFIAVANDGLSMTPEAVAAINAPERSQTVSNHIGLRNVRDRIELRYGQAYGLTADSPPDGLTAIRLTLPVVYENKEEDGDV